MSDTDTGNAKATLSKFQKLCLVFTGLGLLITLIISCINGGWRYGVSSGSSERQALKERIAILEESIVQFEETREWNLPELLGQITEANDGLRTANDRYELTLAERDKLRTLQVAIDEASARMIVAESNEQSLEAELHRIQRELLEANVRLIEFQGNEIVVSVGTARSIGVPGLAIGVSEVRLFSTSSAKVNFGGRFSSLMSVGDLLEAELAGVTYRATLITIAETECVFMVTVIEEAE